MPKASFRIFPNIFERIFNARGTTVANDTGGKCEKYVYRQNVSLSYFVWTLKGSSVHFMD
jgi:hypothetical protein